MELHRQSSSSGSPAKDERTAPSRSRNCPWCDQEVSDREGALLRAPGRANAVGVSKTRNALGIVSDPAPHLDVSVFLIVVQHTLPHQESE